MINYIAYNDDGDIIKTGKCKASSMHLQGDNVIEGVADDQTQKVVDGKLVDKDTNNSIVLEELRLYRNQMIADTDWTQIPDAPLTKAKKDQYKRYRTALRDLPSKYDTITSIEEVTFPNLEDF